MRTQVRKAFTLVEILIVVVILGILAAIVVPQFTNATQDAQGGNVVTQLDTLNNQIELYRARTNNYPDFAANGWNDLVTGNYIKASPINPVNGQTTVGNAFAVGSGWAWILDAQGIGTLYACEFDHTAKRPVPGQPGNP